MAPAASPRCCWRGRRGCDSRDIGNIPCAIAGHRCRTWFIFSGVRATAALKVRHFRCFGCEQDLCELTKTRQNQKWQRDPEGMRLRILDSAKEEFAAHGLAGARVDRIAAKAGANKRMLYYHVGKKDDLYLAVLEGAYEKIRVEERGLDLEHLDPPEAIERLIGFTWNYFIRNPEFLALLNTENLARARHLKRSAKVKSMHSPFVEMIRTVVTRGVESGDFVVAVDPVQLYISIAALSFFYLSNSATLSIIFGRDLLGEEARDERLDHMVALVLAALTGKSLAAFASKKTPKLRAVVHSDA